ncbi:MAG: transporter [Pricia sp.]
MNPKNTKRLIVLASLITASATHAQGIIDGFYNPKGKISLTASYTRTAYDEFYVAEEKVGPVPAHNKVTQDILGIYAKYGVSDNLTLLLNAPYISAQGEGDPDPVNGETEQSGFQDLAIAAKYRPLSLALPGGKIDGITSLGIGIPAGYEPNGILSIGTGAFTTDLHVGGHLQLEAGFFGTLAIGYSFRGKADDTFNPSDGEDFDVPNAFLAMGKVGFTSSKFYAEAWVDYQGTSSDGVDIMGPGFAGNFPETRVDYTRFGVSAYVPIISGLGVSAGFGTVLDGRNVGDTTYFNTGVTYSFDTLSTNTNL